MQVAFCNSALNTVDQLNLWLKAFPGLRYSLILEGVLSALSTIESSVEFEDEYDEAEAAAFNATRVVRSDRACIEDANVLNLVSDFPISDSPLWIEGRQLSLLNDDPRDRTLSHWQSTIGNRVRQEPWLFWRDWYQGFLDGKPLDWELQRRVALIDDPIWEAGPEAVAKQIEHIQAQMLAENLPMAERIEVNPDTGKFRAIPIPVENPTTLSALLSQIEDALEDCLGGHNGLAERSGTVKKLNRVLTKYKDDPQNAELTLTRVAGSLRSQLHETKELADNEDNLALLDTVEEGVRGIRANHSEVAKNREQLAQQAIHALTPEDKVLLQQALPVLAEISEPDLADDFATDIPELINDALLPLPAGAPPLPGSDATTRVFSRVSKMAIAAEQGAKILDSNEIKTVRLAHLGYTALELFYSLVQIGLRILGVL